MRNFVETRIDGTTKSRKRLETPQARHYKYRIDDLVSSGRLGALGAKLDDVLVKFGHKVDGRVDPAILEARNHVALLESFDDVVSG